MSAIGGRGIQDGVGSVKSGGTTPSTEFNIAKLPAWSAAVRLQRSGGRNARVLCVGDSTTAGYGASSTAMTANDVAAAYPAVLASVLTARGSKGNSQNMIGTRSAATLSAYDSRITYGAAWAPTASARSAGGPVMFSSGTPNALNFAPTASWDTAELYYTRTDTTNVASLIAAINGVDKATYSIGVASGDPAATEKAVLKNTSAGLNTLNLRASTILSTNVLGIVTYREDTKEVLVMNAGWSGAKASDWISQSDQTYGPIPMIARYSPDLVLLNLGINDAGNNVTKSDYLTQMQQIIDASKATGADVVLIVPNDCNPVQLGTKLIDLSGWIIELAISNNLICVDLRGSLGFYATAVAAGLMRDNLHPNAGGYSKIATTIANVIMPAA